MLSGCEVNSWFDPSVVGSWQHTPVELPILDRIASIESETAEVVEYSDPTGEDLIPEPREYRFGPGDAMDVTAYDLIEQGAAPEVFSLQVDTQGYIEMPQLGRLYVSGATLSEARQIIEEAAKRLVGNPLISVVPSAQRNQTFNLVGGVSTPGPYFIPKADYRILEALTQGGRFDESIPEVYVIRQVALSSYVKADTVPPSSPSGSVPQDPSKVPTGQELLEIIDQITPGAQPPAGQPGLLSARSQAGAQPEPAVDLVEGSSRQSVAPASNWVFLNGQWVQLPAKRDALTGQSGLSPDDLVTQRVIRVPLKPLLAGKQSMNIVVRPGDVIRVPTPEAGNVYLGGQINRPGSFQLPTNGKLTLMRAVFSAGGLTETAIPERVDLTRMVGRDRQATIRLNLRDIAKGVQPDVYLKADDQINFGTNFWAFPLAVVRGGFRASYGYGFILDRNFGNDVFGVPPGSTRN
jgi:polysaccharide export outer membrane protein